MANQQHIDALKKFAQMHDSWILLRDDVGKKPIMLFKYSPGSWNVKNDQIGLGNPEDSNPPYVFWALTKNAQWEIESESNECLHIKGPVGWWLEIFETEEETNARISQLKAF